MLATAHRDWTPQSYTFLMCKGTDSMESHSAFAYLPTIWTLLYIYWIMNFTQRDTSDRHDNTKAELPHRHGLEESPLAVLSVGEIHPIISWFHNDTTLIGVSRFLAGCHSTWKPSPESEVGLWAPDSAQSAAERSWNWYQVEETHLQISLHLLSDLPFHCRLPSCLIYSSFHLHSADCCPTFFIPLVVFDGLPGDDCSSLSLTLCKV